MTATVAGRVAVVTGAGSRGEGIGNGRAAAVLLARAGARVALVDQVPEWAEVTRGMIEAEGGDARVISGDVSDVASCKEIVREVVGSFDAVDVLVNNVGIAGPPGDSVEVDPDEWDRGMRVNVKSMMLMSKFCIPEMRKRGGGAIVNISSVAGLRGGHPAVLYATAKGAVVSLTRAMAVHHGAENIRVNCVAPGMVYTPMVASRGMTEEMREARRLRSPLQTEGTGWDTGEAVVFLASPQARWITGVVLPVDGGATAAVSGLTVPPLGP